MACSKLTTCLELTEYFGIQAQTLTEYDGMFSFLCLYLKVNERLTHPYNIICRCR
jgi:hypothetical protein